MQAERIFAQVLEAGRSAGVSDIEAIMGTRSQALTRFANNTIHQNVAEETHWLSVRAIIDGRTARASTNRTDLDAIRQVVAEAVALTKAVEPDPDVLPLAKPQPITKVDRFDDETAETTPDVRASSIAEAIRIVESSSQTAAGIFSTESLTEWIYNSAGIATEHSETMARFSITSIAEDSSGWAKASATSRKHLDPVALAFEACQKANKSANPRELPPGRYTVITEPSATLDLVGQMFGDFSGTAIQDQRSFLNNRIGAKVFGENITIADDVYHPLQAGPPFGGEGLPRQRLLLVDAGVPRQIAYSRAAAKRANVEPTGHEFPVPNEMGEAPVNIVIAGGSTPLEAMLMSTDHGILVTRFWYIREVDPYEKIMTGMTRDGTFLIENGRIVCGIKNFRFNQSLIEMLNNVEALSPSVRASGEEYFDLVAPAMKVRDFNFTEVTRF